MSAFSSLWVDRGLVLCALLLAGTVFLTRESVTTTEVDARSTNLLRVWRQAELRALVLESPHILRLEVHTPEKTGQLEWSMSGPGYPRMTADAAAVDQLLNELRMATWVRTLERNEADLHAFGLDAPRAVLSIEMGAIDYRLVLGKPAPAPSGGSYLAISGEGIEDAVGIVKQSLVDSILVDPREFLGRALVPYGRSDITRLELSGAGGTRRLKRDGHRFRFQGMLGERVVDGDALDPMFFHLARLTREGFLSVPEAEAALARGERVDLRIWTSTTKTPLTLAVGGRCKETGKVVALRLAPDPLAGCVPETVMAGLTLTAEALVDRTPFGFGADAVERVVTERRGRRFELVRDATGFSLKSPAESKVDLNQGNQRIETLVNTKGELVDAPDLTALGLTPPVGETTVTGLSSITDLAVDERVAIGKADSSGRLPLLRRIDSVVLLLPAEAARAFEVDATLTKDLTLFSFSDEDVLGLRVSTRTLEQSLRRLDSSFQLEKPAGFDFDASLLSELLEALRKLTADRWVSDTEDPSFGFEEPSATVELHLLTLKDPTAKARTETLTIGQSIPGGAYAKVSRIPGVFVLATEAARAVTTPVLSRQAFAIDPSTLDAIDFETSERKVSVAARAGGWSSDTPSVDVRHAGRIMDCFAGLRPLFAWHIGKPSKNEGFDKPTLVVRLSGAARGTSAAPGTTITVGAPHTFAGLGGYFARVTGVDATFVLTETSVRQLLDLL